MAHAEVHFDQQPITVGVMLDIALLWHSAEGKMFGRQELYR